jgi:chromosome segregation ATPase
MTSDVTDMSTPVTRGELREELAQLEERVRAQLGLQEHRIDGKLDQLRRDVDVKFDVWGGALLARITESEKRFDGLEKRFDGLETRFVESEERLLAELARHARAIQESFAMQISVVDEKYKDLPARMNRVEAEVEALKPRKPAARPPHARRRRGPSR